MQVQLDDYNNTTITGGTSGVIAEVVGVAVLLMVLIQIQYLLNIIKQEQIILQLYFQMVKQLHQMQVVH